MRYLCGEIPASATHVTAKGHEGRYGRGGTGQASDARSGCCPRAGKVAQGDLGGANLTITMNSSTFAEFYDNPRGYLMNGFFAGKIKLVGNQMAGEKFADLIELAK